MQVVHKSVPTKSRKFCSVPQCTNYCTKDVSLHNFPNDSKLCQRWKHILKIGKPISKFMYVCSQHFLACDFFPVNPHTELKKARLKKDVVPSQKLPIRRHDRPETRTRRTINRKCSEKRTVKKEEKNYDVPPLFSEESVHVPEPSTSTTSHSIRENVPPFLNTFIEDKAIQTDCSEFFQLSQLLKSDEKLQYFTGVNHGILESYSKCVRNVADFNDIATENLNLYLILILCKIKTNMSFVCLSVLFGMSPATCTRLFYKYQLVLNRQYIGQPKEEILQNMPLCFENFKMTRVVLDATEIKVQKLNCLRCRILSYSHYKCSHTMKFLIGITPSGLISYVSKGYGGRASDKAIFNKENIIDKLDPYDAIMVDKGILIEKECNDHFVKLIRPPFLKKQKQFSKEDATTTANIARARVHVERVIQRIKTFNILSDQIDWYIIPYIEDIMTIVAATVNMSSPILADDKF
ncbi:hypothetical protein NQ317_012965 [Molorchus minor]|uniref:THAP-type domain-containing protein n=1 Tax=Molorchus minor TaxID=1323400 RepID=A0ABQ9JFZ9_9CUCU|nr:hypothetical protein NQ317_012965 [Molorchus minor]